MSVSQNTKALTVVSYGGGVNSTAMLIGLVEHGERPDAILFADTGGERPQVYEYLENFSGWLVGHGFPKITTVRKGVTVRPDGSYQTLEEECLLKGMLPSIAYGGKGCSWKYKREVMDKWCNNWEPAQRVWAGGGKVLRLIGFDAGERHRSARGGDEKYLYGYQLREWGWGRAGCESAIVGAGLCLPLKSACFFCSATKKHEVRRMSREEPDLFERALAIERGAKATGKLTSVKGLGRDWSWEDVANADKAQLKLFAEPPQVPCDCWT